MNNDLNEIKYILNDDLKYNQVIETPAPFPHIEGYTFNCIKWIIQYGIEWNSTEGLCSLVECFENDIDKKWSNCQHYKNKKDCWEMYENE